MPRHKPFCRIGNPKVCSRNLYSPNSIIWVGRSCSQHLHSVQAVKQVPWMQEGAVRACFQARLFISSWFPGPNSVSPISFLHSVGPQRKSLLGQLWDQDEAFTLTSLSFSVEKQDTSSTIKQASWNCVSLSQSSIYFQYKVILLKLVHWREEEYICHFVSSKANWERERHVAGWLRTCAFLEQWCLKQLLPPQPLLIHLPSYILVVRVCYGWQLTERNEERAVERKSQTAFSQHCF